jgi:hypothetical protein
LIINSCAFVPFETADQAATAIKELHGAHLDRAHTITVKNLDDLERYAGKGEFEFEILCPALSHVLRESVFAGGLAILQEEINSRSIERTVSLFTGMNKIVP